MIAIEVTFAAAVASSFSYGFVCWCKIEIANRDTFHYDFYLFKFTFVHPLPHPQPPPLLLVLGDTLLLSLSVQFVKSKPGLTFSPPTCMDGRNGWRAMCAHRELG